MSEQVSADTKTDLIKQILEVELVWFLTVNPEITSECQLHPDAFKLIRGSSYETWSEKTLALYLEFIVGAMDKGINLMREKYAKIQNLIPCLSVNPALHKSLSIEKEWQKEAAQKYPNIFQKEATDWALRYLECELDTYSDAVLAAHYEDRLTAKNERRNLVIETYDRMAKKLGFSSIEEWNQKQAATK